MSLSVMSILSKVPTVNKQCIRICSYLNYATRNISLKLMPQSRMLISSSTCISLSRVPSAQKATMSTYICTPCNSTRILSKTFGLSGPHRFNILKYSTRKPQLPFEKDTNVTKNVIIFSHNNDKFYKMLSVFGLAQFLFWGYLSMFCYYTLKDAPVEKSLGKDGEITEKSPWWRLLNLGQNKYRNGIALLCFSIGYFVLFVSTMYPLRSVQSLWLLKGGKSVGITTFGPFGRKSSIVSPLEEISCAQSRTQAASQIPLKVKGRWFFFLLDKKGEFHNPELFDYAVGLKRNLK